MATIYWNNGQQTIFTDPAGWAGGLVPGTGDTAVISSAGDSAGTIDSITGLLDATSDGSAVDFASTPLDTETTLYYQPDSTSSILVSESTPQESMVPAGLTIGGGVIDLLGAGGANALYLQNSDFGTATVVNVSGVALLSSSYTGYLQGTINIGFPITVAGAGVPGAPADARGLTSELDIAVQAYGSWNDSGARSGYVPTLTNAGPINIAGGGGLYVYVKGGEGSAFSLGLENLYTAPSTADFTNQSNFIVNAGGTLSVEANNKDGYFDNDGVSAVDGAQGDTTTAIIGAVYGGTGELLVDGGNQSDATKTSVVFDGNNMTGGVVALTDASATFYVQDKVVENTFTGGTLEFTDARSQVSLLATANTDLLINSIVGSFTNTIIGFQAGDSITISVDNDDIENRITATTDWNQAQHLLDIYEIGDIFGEPQDPAPVAELTIAGNYGAGSFNVSRPGARGPHRPAARGRGLQRGMLRGRVGVRGRDVFRSAG